LLNLDQPRQADLPDLSAYVPAPVPAAPSPAAATSAVPSATPPLTPMTSSFTADGPAYYQDMVQLADMVRNQLKTKGVTEANALDALPAIERAAQTTAAFTARAAALRPDTPT
jgi:hypothetical protein